MDRWGPNTDQWNDDVYQMLLTERETIEDAFGGPLEWWSKSQNRSRRVFSELAAGGWGTPDDWDATIPATVMPW